MLEGVAKQPDAPSGLGYINARSMSKLHHTDGWHMAIATAAISLLTTEEPAKHTQDNSRAGLFGII